MAFIGWIAGARNETGVDLARWTEVVARHPNLIHFDDREGINPFTRAAHIYRAHPGDARVVLDGADVGSMTWAQDRTNRIAVDGDRRLVEPVAREVASKVRGQFFPAAE